MTVLTPLFLLGLAALAIPILLHLLRKPERRTRVFPALRYLKRTTRKHARIIRLRQLFLLALRLSSVLLIALAGARLVLPLGGNDDPPAGLAIVVDNGLTSGGVVEGGRVLDSIIVRALQALDRTGPRDQVWVVPAGDPSQISVPLSPDRARSVIEALNPTHVTPSLPAALDRAGSLLEVAAPELRELVVVSDLRSDVIGPIEVGTGPRSTRVVIAPPPRPLLTNRGVGDLLISGGLAPRAGEPGEIGMRVVGTDVAGSTVRGYVEGRLVGTTSVGADGTVVLPLPRLSAGWVEGRVEVEPDGLRGGDVAYFAVRAILPPSVQILGPIAPFLEEALFVLEEAGRIRLIQDGEAMVEVMSTSTVNGPSSNATVIVVPPDEAALLPSLNQELNELLPGWSLEAGPPDTGTELRVDEGILIELLPSRPSVRQAYTIRAEGLETGWSELLTLSDGRPWITESEAAGRSIIVLASPMTVEASDLPSSASMLPLVELLTSRSSGSITETNLRAGQSFILVEGAANVRLPDGTLRSVVDMGVFREPQLSGVYHVLDANQQVLALVAVNPVSPTSTGALTASDAASRLSEAWGNVDIGEPWPQSVLRDRRGREVAGPFLIALFLLLVAESWLASVDPRNSRQTEERGPEQTRE